MIDRQKLNDTFQYYDKDVIINIIDLFEKELPGRLKIIEKNILAQDFESLIFNVHSLKSIAGSFMDYQFSELAGTIENQANLKNHHEIQELFERLKSSSNDLLAELIAIRKELS